MMSSAPLKIPPELVESVARGSCVLFLGADYALGDSGPPTRAQLAAALAEKYGLSPDQSLPDAAEQFLGRQPKNRHALVDFLREQLAPAPTAQPNRVYRTVVDLDFDAVVSAWYDDRPERVSSPPAGAWRAWCAVWT